MRTIYFAVVMSLLLSACTASADAVPTATTVPPTAAPTILPTETVPPVQSVLGFFPLAEGARWEYAAEIEYQDPDDTQATAIWTGVVAVEVVGQEMIPDGKMVFTLEETLSPDPPDEVWRGARSFQYTVSENEIIDGAQSVLQWPLEDGQAWKTWPDSDFVYQTEVSYKGDVETPYGALEDCYAISILTGPDIKIEMFCPGVGIVQLFYHHFGTPQNEFFELTLFEPGE